MKKIFATLAVILAVLALVCSCTQKAKVIPERAPEGLPPVVDVDPVRLTLTFVLPEGGVKSAWEAGDKIVVHGEYAKDQVTVTLAAGDIGSDGRVATQTVDGLKPYVREDLASNLYAAWPAELVQNPDHCFFYSGFNTTNALLMAACNDADNKFQFKELTAAIDYNVSGDFDTYAFTGRKDAQVGYEYLQVKVTEKEFIIDQYHRTPVVTISGSINAGMDALQQIYLPAGTELPAGFDLKFYKDGEAKKVYTVKTETTAEPGKPIDLGDITAGLKDFQQAIDVTKAVNLAPDGNANCYIVTEPGIYKFPTVKGNSSKSVGTVESTKVLWETWNNGETVTEGSLISNTMFEGGQFYFEVPSPFHAGNALVAVLDENETILWSWHIWMPETEPTADEYGYAVGCKIMGRNLGALVDTQPGVMADPRSFGLFYQWGRKDPFLGPKEAGSDESATFVGTAMTTHSERVTQDQSSDDLEETATMPTTFLTVTGADWNLIDDREAWGDQERSNKKTIYDPCPYGYRVGGRKRGQFYEPDKNPGVAATFSASVENAYYLIGNPSAAFPLCGYLDEDGTYYADGALVWNTHMDHDTANSTYCMLVSGGSLKKGQKSRSIGASIRCETYDE